MKPQFYSARLDARRIRHDNDEVRVRPVLIALAFAVLAFAGLRGDDARSVERHGPLGNDTACVLAAQPATDVDPPAIIRAAVATPAAPQTHLDIEWLGRTPLVNDAGTAVRHTRTQPGHRVTSPHTFPLLI